MKLTPLPRVMVEPLVRAALLEDLGRAGDITTDAIVPADASATMVLATRQPGVIAGIGIAALTFELNDPSVEVAIAHPDGAAVSAGDVIATLRGPARALLTAERTALNLLCHLSGISTQTAAVVEAVRGHRAKIVCTRKTTPGLRALEKYAVRAG
ncbi:MAG: nicotinate-nucleotide diphosphorylase (carboxylating), partial [Alphaproteobacteria bacterium]|nr:nicotinate-nucleotide diphosphorylase (carboxylating) [Alphaproteobacteria bacterium]